VLVGGPCVAQGYYNDPENPDAELTLKNTTDFSVDPVDGTRYFHTGDIGQMTKAGMLQLIDRKKDLIKLQMGEYVALSKVENAMKLCSVVENCLCYALPSKSNVVALIVPNEAALRKCAAAAAAGADAPLAALCANEAVVKEVLAAVRAAAKPKLAAFEVPVRIALLPTPWTPENDMVTAAMKLKRQTIVAANKATLDRIYA
jgi:long-chain acyl-CoA synthetase